MSPGADETPAPSTTPIHASPEPASIPTLLSRCPECGRDSASLERALASAWHWSRTIPIAAAALCLLGLVIWQLFTPQTSRVSLGHPLGRFVEPGVTRQTLQAIIADPKSSHTLTRSVLDAVEPWTERILPARTGVRITFGAPPTSVTETRYVGWPLDFLEIRRDGLFDDALSRTGFIASWIDPARPFMQRWEVASTLPHAAPREMWFFASNKLVIRPPPERTGGWDTNIQANIGVLLIDIVLWWAGALVVLGGLRFVQRRFRTKTSSRARGRHGVAFVGALLLFALASAMSQRSISNCHSSLTAYSVGNRDVGADEWATLPFDTLALRSLLADPDGDRILARELLRTTANTGTSATPMVGIDLVVAPLPESDWDALGTTLTTYGAAIPLWTKYQVTAAPRREWAFSDRTLLETGPVRFSKNEITFFLDHARKDPTTGAISFSKTAIRWSSAGVVFGAMLAAWAVVRTLSWMICSIIFSRRRQSCRCLACGYALAGLPPQPK